MLDDPASVCVETPARLHFGMLDLRGEVGRRFGGIGAAIREPSLLLEVSAASKIEAEGPGADRIPEIARRVLTHYELSGGARFLVHRSLPAHAGLGSGTQLSLAVARALTTLHRRPEDAGSLALATDRARRSAVGTWTFAHGGFVLEGGRAEGEEAPAPLLARLPMPRAWRCVLVVPPGRSAMTGDAEVRAFASLPRPPREEVEHVAHLVLMAILPALAKHDLAAFGAALTEVQHLNGGWFARAQGGVFATAETAALVRALDEWGAAGVGQSSWGPTVYAIVHSEAEGEMLVRRVRARLGPDSMALVTPFDDEGARVWHGAPGARR